MASSSPTSQEPGPDRTRGEVARFLRIVTHDLRQPIATTRTLLSVLATGYAGPLGPSQADLVGRVEQRLESHPLAQEMASHLLVVILRERERQHLRRVVDLAVPLRQLKPRRRQLFFGAGQKTGEPAYR